MRPWILWSACALLAAASTAGLGCAADPIPYPAADAVGPVPGFAGSADAGGHGDPAVGMDDGGDAQAPMAPDARPTPPLEDAALEDSSADASSDTLDGDVGPDGGDGDDGGGDAGRGRRSDAR